MPISLIVLAAGAGTRMNSDLPKVLHSLAGAPLFAHAIASAASLEPARTVLVTGHGGAKVATAAQQIDPDIVIATQAEQRGTAHAVLQAAEALRDVAGDAVVLFGDTPLLRPGTLSAMAQARQSSDLVVLGFEPADPGRYGRLIVQDGTLERIVEARDATDEELRIDLCNGGVMMADAATLLDLAGAVGCDNAAGEHYLTDIVAIARGRGLTAVAVTCPEEDTLGINTRAELARAEAIWQERARAALLEDGVGMTAPHTVMLSHDTAVGRDATIEPYVVFGPGVTVESGATIRAFSHLEGCHVGSGAVVGPYARLRPGAELENDARVGNFVEVKNAQIGEGAKIPHLSYIGDADIGARANLGAGTVTCNYDGVSKHRTSVGAGAFVGSSTMLVAPVALGDGAMTASGSVITSDVPAGALAFGRARQETRPGLATRLVERLRAARVGSRGEDG